MMHRHLQQQQPSCQQADSRQPTRLCTPSLRLRSSHAAPQRLARRSAADGGSPATVEAPVQEAARSEGAPQQHPPQQQQQPVRRLPAGPLPPPPGARRLGAQPPLAPLRQQPAPAQPLVQAAPVQQQQQQQSFVPPAPQQQQQQQQAGPVQQERPEWQQSPFWWKNALHRNQEVQRQQRWAVPPAAAAPVAEDASRQPVGISGGAPTQPAGDASPPPPAAATGSSHSDGATAAASSPAASSAPSDTIPAAETRSTSTSSSNGNVGADGPPQSRLAAAQDILAAAMKKDLAAAFQDDDDSVLPERPAYMQEDASWEQEQEADSDEPDEPEQQQQQSEEQQSEQQPGEVLSSAPAFDAASAGTAGDSISASAGDAAAAPPAPAAGASSSRRRSRRSSASGRDADHSDPPAPPQAASSRSRRRSRQAASSTATAAAAADGEPLAASGSGATAPRSRTRSRQASTASVAASDATGAAPIAPAAPMAVSQQTPSPPPQATQAAAAAAVHRRARATGGSTSAAAAVEQALAGQRSIAAARRRQASVGSSSSTSSSSTTKLADEPGDIKQLADGKWVLTGFKEDAQALSTLVPTLQQRLRGAVEAEQQHEAAAIQALYTRSSLTKLERDGLVLLRLTATPHSVLYSSLVWRFARAQRAGGGGGKQAELPHHRFRQGDSLLVSAFEDAVEGQQAAAAAAATAPAAAAGASDLRTRGFRPLDATVLEVRKDHLLLALDKADSDQLEAALRRAASPTSATWRLDQSVRDTTARRQLEAVKRLSGPTSDSAFEALLRQVLLCTPNAVFMASMAPCWARSKDWRLTVRDLLRQPHDLNDSQRRAIADAVTHSLTLWQGPPGTGKTRTLLALIEVLVRADRAQKQQPRNMGPVLACADTNAAVDNLVEGLMDRGLCVVRLGQPAKVRESLRKVTLEALAEATPDGQKAARLREASKVLFKRAKQAAEGRLLGWGNSSRQSLRSRLGSNGSGRSGGSTSSAAAGGAGPPVDSEAAQAEARRCWAQAEQLTRAAAKQVLEAAEVVCATCAGAGDQLLSNRSFKMVVIDEATQATEPATLVPLTQGAECVVMAGDPAQLPPTITSRQAAQAFDLQTTLFERLQAAAGLSTQLLDTQYRMHPAIAAFPSRWFYAAALKDGVTAADKPPAAGLDWSGPQRQPVMVVAVQGLEERAKKTGAKDAICCLQDAAGADLLLYGGGPAYDDAAGLMEASYRNLPEARLALQAAHALLAAGDVASVAVLTPYKGQVRALERGLRLLAPWFGPELLRRVSVSSIDGYQGREADAVVLTAVRCNARGSIGFVADKRRLNVAITRPRRGLVVICSPPTLRKGSADWAAFFEHVEAAGWVVGPDALPAGPWQTDGGMDPFSADDSSPLSSL